eukprot:6207454-Pleurochrysis_carterae.AAC.2
MRKETEKQAECSTCACGFLPGFFRVMPPAARASLCVLDGRVTGMSPAAAVTRSSWCSWLAPSFVANLWAALQGGCKYQAERYHHM